MLTACRRSIGAGIATVLLAAMVFPWPADGQLAKVHLQERPAKGSTTNLFATWEGGERLDGLMVEVPADWSVVSASFLREAFRSVPGRLIALDARRYRVLLEKSLDDPAEIVLTLQVGGSYAAERLDVIPIVRSAERRSLGISETVRAVESVTDPQEQILSFAADEAEPIAFRRDAVPELHVRRPFSLSFWMKSTGLGEIVLSTWDGADHASYPVEIVVDRAGRLRAFRGRPGEHQSLGSTEPVADGHWHRVHLVNDPADGWLRLMVDGNGVDSLYAPVPPDIRSTQPLVLGGRADGENAYFDGLSTYSGSIDELNVATEDAAGEPAALSVGFESRMSPDLLERPVRGVERIDSDRFSGEEIQNLRVDHVPDGVILNWTSSSPDVQEFVVERSGDGSSFEEIARAAPTPDGVYQLHDDGAGSGVVYYRVRQILSDEVERVSGTIKVGIGGEQPHSAVLIGNYPNPFNATTTITYEVRQTSDVQLGIWDLSGQPVQALVDRRQSPGTYQARFEADGLPSGTYFVRLRTPGGLESHKVILTK